MKKILMMALMAIVALGAYADDEPEFTVTSGSFVDVVRQPGKTATVEFNYLDAKTGNLRSKSLTDKTLREKLATEDEDVYKDWDDILENSKEYFVKRWNEEKKKNVKMLEKGKGDYHFVFTASAFDTGNAGASYWSVSKRDGGITVNAILEIKDASVTSFKYLGFDEDSCMNYFAVLPTDLQAYADDEAVMSEYAELYDRVDGILDGVRISGEEGAKPVPNERREARVIDMYKDVQGLGFSFKIPYDWEFGIVDGKARAVPKDDASGFTEIRIEKFDKDETTAGELTESLYGKFKENHKDAVVSGPELTTYEPEGTDRRIAGVRGSFSSVDASRIFAEADLVEYVGDEIYLYHCGYVAETNVPGETADNTTWRRFLSAVDSLEAKDGSVAEDVEAWILGE